MLPFDDGAGAALFVAGEFVRAGGVEATGFARWDGSSFSAPGGGLDSSAFALATFDAGAGADLVVAGAFTAAGGAPSERAAIYRDRCVAALRGSVNAGRGLVQDVLFVNDSAGDSRRRFRVDSGAPIRIAIEAPASATGPVPFAVGAWLGEPTPETTTELPFAAGTTAFPLPLRGVDPSPAPVVVFDSTGRPVFEPLGRRVPEAPTILVSRPHAPPRAVTFTLQGVIADPGSAGSRRASATNGVVVAVGE
jgi:hypothetical protein